MAGKNSGHGSGPNRNNRDIELAVSAGEITMDVTKDSIIQEAQRTGKMWMPLIDPDFVAAIRLRYDETGVSATTVDAVLEYVGSESQERGETAAWSWITAFQATVILEKIAQSDGAISDSDHRLMAYFAELQRDSMG